jgi:DNA-binding MarR family transcriptional regulator
MVDLKLIGFVARAKRRKETLNLLSKHTQLSQPEIMRSLNQYKSHNSATIKELVQKDLIKCINPEDRSFKFYKITKKGRNILKEVFRISGE